MAYFSINGIDFSDYVNELKVSTVANYSAQTNAAGNTVVDYINSKKNVEVGLIPMDEADMQTLLSSLGELSVAISFLNPETNTVSENVNCICGNKDVEYYFIQEDRILYKPFKLKFVEL